LAVLRDKTGTRKLSVGEVPLGYVWNQKNEGRKKMKEMKIEEKKIIRKKIIFYLLLERRKNERKETTRNRVFLCFGTKRNRMENIICVAINVMPFTLNTTTILS
jgi:hypothetical protein